MPAHRKDAQADAMYALYQQGFSLAQVAKAFGTNRQNVYKIFSRRGWFLRTIEPLPFIMWNGRKYTRKTDGYYRRTSGKRRTLHQEVWEHHRGPIPAGHEVHHDDQDKSNNAIENLKCVTSSEHGKIHAPTNEGFKRTQFKKCRSTCDAAVEILRETGNAAVMFGDAVLLYAIAERAGLSQEDRRPFQTATRVLDGLTHKPGILIPGKTMCGGRMVRIFRLPNGK